MSNQNIEIISDLLLGITNVDNNERTLSVNKLQYLKENNFDILLFSLLEIIEKNFAPKDNSQALLKTTSLIICRKIIETVEYNTWQNINNDFKIKFKNKLLALFNNEINLKNIIKLNDIIIELLRKLIEFNEIWPEILNLTLNIFNYEPNQGDKFNFQIVSLLYIIKGGINFFYKEFSKSLEKLVNYLEKIFNSSNIDANTKILTGELIAEMISLANTKEIEIIRRLIKNIMISLYNCYQLYINIKQNEKNIKSFLKICIDIEGIEPNLLLVYFQDIFYLMKQIISDKTFNDQKIREMAFELLISILEDNPSLFTTLNGDNILNSFLELAFNYALEFDKNMELNLSDIPLDDNMNSIDLTIEDEITFLLSLLERIFECTDKEKIKNILNIVVNNFIHQSWKHQYVILLSLNIYCSNNDDMYLIDLYADYIFDLIYSNEIKVKFASLFLIKNLMGYYKNVFINKYISKILPLILQLLKKDKNIRCRYEVLNCFKYIIHYNNSDVLNNSIEKIFNDLMYMFIENNIHVILRKLILLNILELNNKKNNENINLLLNSIDINAFMTYFINLYNKKADFGLYGVLLELIASVGIHSIEKFNKIIPNILFYVIQLLKDYEDNEKKNHNIFSICELKSSFVKIILIILPILINKNDNINMIYELMNIVISLIKSKNISNIDLSSINEPSMINLYDEEKFPNDEDQNIYNIQIKEFSSLLSILLSILNSIDSNNIQKIQQFLILIESEVLPLITFRSDKYIRKKSSKILEKLIILNYDNEQKNAKSYLFINSLINGIEKETDALNTKYFLERIREIMDCNDNEFLNKYRITKIFNTFFKFINNLKIKRNQLIEKQNSIKEKYKEAQNKNVDNKNLNEIIEKEIKSIEDIQIEIGENIGILLKTHKDKCEQIIDKIINKLIPSYLNSNNNFEIKIALYLSDDLIEYIGQEKIIEKDWEMIYYIINKYIFSDDYSIKQAAAYGMGIFALQTKNNFSKYGQKLIDNLCKSLNLCIKIKNDNKMESKEDFLISFDNLVAALGKIINVQFNNEIIQNNINDLIEKWIMNLPIKYDESEQEQQHEWMVDFFIYKRNLIPFNCYFHYFESLAEIYQSKYSNKNIDFQIELIFSNFVKKEDKLRNILAQIYENASYEIKNKLNILAQKN